MGDKGIDGLGAIFPQRVCGKGQSVAGIDHVVDENCNLQYQPGSDGSDLDLAFTHLVAHITD